MNEHLQSVLNLWKDFDNFQDKWNLPFPMGVFGTLRLGRGNSPLMGPSADGSIALEDEYIWKRPDDVAPFQSHHKAFAPHFTVQGLSIHHEENAAGVFEIFTYKPEDWPRMIPDVDRLEGFTPGIARHGGWGYHRTLMMLHLLPDDFKHELYEHPNVWSRNRVLDIPPDKWNGYPQVPCWVYSSCVANEQNLKLGDKSPVLWYG